MADAPTPDDDKVPIQVTEADVGKISFEPSYRPVAETSVYQLHGSFYHQSRTTENRENDTLGNIPSQTRLFNPLGPPRYQDYALESLRTSSFSSWNASSKPDVSALVDSGFFYTGNIDLVRCFHCGIGFKDWLRDDDPLTEHVKHSPSCEYLEWKLGRSELERMKIAVLAPGFQRDATNTGQLPYIIRTPIYQTMEARIASFKNFPNDTNLTPHQLAISGLYYTGEGDLCRCFTCDGGLKDWRPGDDPVREHASFFSSCTYINQLKGREYVRSAQQERRNNPSEGAPWNNSGMQSQVATQLHNDTTQSSYSSFTVSQVVQHLGYAEIDIIVAKAELERKGNRYPSASDVVNTILDMQERERAAAEASTELEVLLEEDLRLTDTIFCKLCAREADALFLPCSHHRVCYQCAVNLEICPVCNKPIQQKIKTFRS